MWSNDIKIVFFLKNFKQSLSGWVRSSQPHSLRRLGAKPPTPVCDTLGLHYLLNTSLNLDILTFVLSLLPIANSYLSAKLSRSFWSSIMRYLCPTKSYSFENFWWHHCMWLVDCPRPWFARGTSVYSVLQCYTTVLLLCFIYFSNIWNLALIYEIQHLLVLS